MKDSWCLQTPLQQAYTPTLMPTLLQEHMVFRQSGSIHLFPGSRAAQRYNRPHRGPPFSLNAVIEGFHDQTLFIKDVQNEAELIQIVSFSWQIDPGAITSHLSAVKSNNVGAHETSLYQCENGITLWLRLSQRMPEDDRPVAHTKVVLGEFLGRNHKDPHQPLTLMILLQPDKDEAQQSVKAQRLRQRKIEGSMESFVWDPGIWITLTTRNLDI